MKSFIGKLTGAICALAVVAGVLVAPAAMAEEKKSFKLAWTIYAGWMPWGYLVDNGIMKKWADKYGIEVEIVQLNDYIETINQYTAGQFDGVALTNMDALTIPAASGVDTTGLVLGDYSNGNDAIVMRGEGATLADIKGKRVNLVELSVSHYTLARALESVGLSERDVTLVNTSDADFVAAWQTPDVEVLVCWNPALSEIMKTPGTVNVFDSTQIPGEIIDMMAVNTETLKANPALGKALMGAWFETMALMSKDDEAGRAARSAMGAAAGTDLAGYDAQLAATFMYYTPADMLAFAESEQLVKTMDYVRKFSFDHGLLGEGAKTIDQVGIEFPGGKTLGDTNNIKLRFDASFVKMAVDGAL